MKPLGRALRFACVGAAASVVHLGVVAGLVPLGLSPLLANGIGFFAAFQISYYGHASWTFNAVGGLRPYGRMLAVSMIAFAANESMYGVLLKLTTLEYRLALALVLASVSTGTFLAARSWVFRPNLEADRARPRLVPAGTQDLANPGVHSRNGDPFGQGIAIQLRRRAGSGRKEISAEKTPGTSRAV